MNRPQSLSGYIRQHLAEMETRLEFGVRQEVLVAELNALGYKTTLECFRNFLYRARVRAAEKKAAGALLALQNQDRAVPSAPLNPTTPSRDDPLTKSKGFEFNGTSSFDAADLI